jgi:hypothetical protein
MVAVPPCRNGVPIVWTSFIENEICFSTAVHWHAYPLILPNWSELRLVQGYPAGSLFKATKRPGHSFASRILLGLMLALGETDGELSGRSMRQNPNGAQ